MSVGVLSIVAVGGGVWVFIGVSVNEGVDVLAIASVLALQLEVMRMMQKLITIKDLNFTVFYFSKFFKRIQDTCRFNFPNS